jgi:predicted YcjX-like family ATPase
MEKVRVTFECLNHNFRKRQKLISRELKYLMELFNNQESTIENSLMLQKIDNLIGIMATADCVESDYLRVMGERMSDHVCIFILLYGPLQ